MPMISAIHDRHHSISTEVLALTSYITNCPRKLQHNKVWGCFTLLNPITHRPKFKTRCPNMCSARELDVSAYLGAILHYGSTSESHSPIGKTHTCIGTIT